MHEVINCFKHNNPVINQKLREVSVEEGEKIAAKLFEVLNKRKDGIGLAANQIGIDAAVAVVNVREPLVLINPKIEEQWDEIDFYEGCLSFPNKGIHTKRYKNVIIKTELSESGWYFSGVNSGEEGKGSWEKENLKHSKEQRLLEAICIQHEIDHLNGMTIMDREKKLKPAISKKKIGRNEPCHCGSGKKYKKCCI